MKKIILLILTLFLLCFSFLCVLAQDGDKEAELSLNQRFPSLKIRDKYSQIVNPSYYRFSTDTLFFEPIDLSYFPHEKWEKKQWGLVGRWMDGTAYEQIIYLDRPAERKIMHGTATGSSRGYLRDFYLYATLFLSDNYPQDTGSCYIYYSDSLMIGFKESKGIMIDPLTGIYEATNSYGGSRHATYTPNTIKHSLELIHEIDPSEFEITPDDAENSSLGADSFVQEKLNEQFARDWETLNNSFRMKNAAPVKAFRIEVIRQNGVDDIYINGKNVVSISDPIRTMNADEEIIPEKVSWSYGPILNEGGLTVTCGVGDLYIYGTGLPEK